MWWRLKRSEFEQQKGESNRRAFKAIVNSGVVPGILAYHDDQPIGWCAVQPREAYPALERSRILKPVDDQPVWSITCFFVARPYRRMGVTSRLIRAAVAFAREQGATIIEGYPKEQKKDKEADVFAWTGYVSAFKQVGFMEVARRSETRPVMRMDTSANK
ncbi:MAG: GNAT family N-acetyltransferase [Fidelibacterota bacterium]|nr:MAG: GNAT family N-acetyltransferase [Candidatus Neomarinimicrobiota bacterium]